MKIGSWNINGLRAWIKKDGLCFITNNDLDVLCLQEVRCSDIPPEALIEDYYSYWLSSGGLAGVGVYTKKEPKNIIYIYNDEFGNLSKPEIVETDGSDSIIKTVQHPTEARLITLEYDNFFLVNVYVPNSGKSLTNLPKRLRWDISFRRYINSLDIKKPVVICGDMNVAHEEIDLTNPSTNKNVAGFVKEERDGMSKFLKDLKFVDTFRTLNPDKRKVYTFWTYRFNARERNIGWRLDYVLVSKRIEENVKDNDIMHDVYGSNHCPIIATLSLPN